MKGLSPIRQIALVLALLLATVVVTAGGLSSYRKIQTFQPLGFEVTAEAGAWLVTDVSYDATSLQPGDRILLVNGDGPGRVDDLNQRLGRRSENELVVMRAGELQTLTHRPPPLEIDFSYLILALTACIYLLIGFYTLLRDLRPPAILFFVWCLVSSAVYLITVTPPFDWLDRGSYALAELALILLAPLTLHLFSVFPRPLAAPGRLRRLIPFFYLPATFLALLQADLMFFNGALLFGGSVATALPVLDQLDLLHLVLFGLTAAGVLAWRHLRLPDPEPQRQATWIALGTAGGYIPFLALYVAPHLFDLTWPALPTALAVLPLALVPLTFSYAILRYKLWDIGIVVRDTLSLSLTILLGVSGFALANLVVNRMVPEDLALGRNLLVFVSGLMIAGLMIPTRRSVGRSLERLQYRDSFSRRGALADFGREILEERDSERLTSQLSEKLAECLEIEPIDLLLVREDGLAPQLEQSALPSLLQTELFDDSFWERAVTPLSAIGFAGEDPAERHLFSAGFRYAFPLMVRQERLGVFVAGYKSNGIPLSSDDLDLLRNLLNQTALALENARLVDEVRRQLAEVLRLQQFSQGIIDSSPAGIAVLDRGGRILSSNQSFAQLVGRPAELIEGKALGDVLPSLTLPQPEDGLREVRVGEGDAERFFQVSTAPIQGSEPAGDRVLVVQDVSERVAMEHALEERDRLAALGVLAAGVAHEVNTPITGISSYAQMLLADTSQEDPHYGLLKKVEKQTFRAARLVNNLLNFARKRSGERTQLDLVPLVGESLDLLQERLSSRQVSLIWQPPRDPVEVFANESEMQQVFTNLILNGIDAMGRDGGVLTIDITHNESMASVGIEDTGSGISHEKLATIFRPFYSTKIAQGGTGLGLSISHDIVRRHGGDLRVISQPGKGSRFIVELPRKEIVGTEDAV
jgi:PAS domain S-box-containing protein